MLVRFELNRRRDCVRNQTSAADPPKLIWAVLLVVEFTGVKQGAARRYPTGGGSTDEEGDKPAGWSLDPVRRQCRRPSQQQTRATGHQNQRRRCR